MIALNAIRISALMIACCVYAQAQGSLVIVDPTINGDTVSLPIHLQGAVSDGVAAMDFQLTFDSAILQPIDVQTGTAAARAGKSVQAELVDDGVYSVMMFGGNLSGVSKGEIARVALTKIAEPKTGETPVAITDTTFATVSSVEIPSLGSTTTLLFELEPDEGGPGSLAPVLGGGTPVDDTPTESEDGTTDTPAPDTADGANPASSGTLSADIAKAGAATDIRIADLKKAQAEREAARANLDQQALRPRHGAKEIRVRQEPERRSADSAPTDDSPPARDLRSNETERSTPSTVSPVFHEVAQEGLELEPILGDKLPPQRYEPGGFVAEGGVAGESLGMRGLGVRAGVVAACIAVALILFAIRRGR